MDTLLHPDQATVTRSDLLHLGFSDAEIDAFEALRANHPYIEFFDSRKELQRLRFMKWMLRRERAIRT